jgi:hypothetical protein
MKMKLSMRLGLMAVMVVSALVIGSVARADSMDVTDTNVTVDSTSVGVDMGQGEIFTCSDSTEDFSCVAGGFTCFGWGNCSALEATGGVPTLAQFIDDYGDGPVQFVDGGALVGTPEPGILLLLCLGMTAVGFLKPHLRTVSR